MEKNDLQEITEKSFSFWGRDNQFRQLQEECAELIVAINKYSNPLVVQNLIT